MNLGALEDYLAKKIYDLIQNVYSEKNAFDLINEEMLLKQSNSENKNKKKKSKKYENKRKRSGSVNKINQNNKDQRAFLINKHNSLDEKKSSIPKSQNENSSEELDRVNIRIKDKQEKFNSSVENCIKNNNYKFVNYKISNNLINNLHNESTEERNSSNNGNNSDKPYNEVSSDESPVNKIEDTESKGNNSEKDTILTVRNHENNHSENESNSGFNSLGIQSKNNNSINYNQVINKMSWRKMTKGNINKI